MKKRIMITGIICLVLLICFPFGIKFMDTSNIRTDESVFYLKSLVWQYDYKCTSMHNDGSYTMCKRFTIFYTITLFENEQKMMVDTESNLVPWESVEVVDEIIPVVGI